jgi:hypothetical protein
MCLVQCSHISGTCRRPMSAQLCLLHTVCVLCCATSISTQLYVHAPVSAPLCACGTVATCIPVHLCITSSSLYTSASFCQHITRLSLSVLAPSACQWLHLLYCIHTSLMSVHLYICAKATPILSCLISSDSLYSPYSLYSSL